uniref:Uncharacterized protein n=1 Tax=Mimivirus LCMiAC02 TaxID=2506609 RepID=A0A481Z241_9VIRU|nr:MAG: hypothetical protein LCMiAC02_02510 [Mimivirus LCMiAC02]
MKKKRIPIIKINEAILKQYTRDIKKNNIQGKRIEKKYVTVMNQYEREKKKRNIFNNKAENKYRFITKVDADDGDDYKCYALNGNYKRCANRVTYLHNGIKNKKIKKKYGTCNVSLCTRHTNLILNSEDKKTSKFGFCFDSDKYT